MRQWKQNKHKFLQDIQVSYNIYHYTDLNHLLGTHTHNLLYKFLRVCLIIVVHQHELDLDWLHCQIITQVLLCKKIHIS